MNATEDSGDGFVKHHETVRAWMDAHPGLYPRGAYGGADGTDGCEIGGVVWIEDDARRVLASARYAPCDTDVAGDCYAGALVAVSVGEAFATLAAAESQERAT